ncbi:MAG: uroporphyrinogen-III C-methyltransferase, partial [Acidobacteriota bacterium]
MPVTDEPTGKVFLVGAGPGDPDLITVKGLRLLQQADVVIYDRLANPALLAHCRSGAETLLVGKRGGHFSILQSDINRLLVEKARGGNRVVRLKGGDSFLFGRGGEEALHLIREGIEFEIVPGVSSALAGPASAGIPVTHRGVASSVAFVTGHSAASDEPGVNWEKLATAADTLVILMPLSNLRRIVSNLVLNGRSITTPAALVESATLDSQRVVTSTLGRIERVAK